MKISGKDYEQLQISGAENFFLHDFPMDFWRGKLNLTVKGEGVWVWDAEGNKLLDMSGALWYKAVGYGRKEIRDAVYAQMEQVESAAGYAAVPVQVQLSTRMAKLAGQPDGRVYLTSGGSESIETAVKMACVYKRATDKPQAYKVIARRGSYHGSTAMAVSLGKIPLLDTVGVSMPGVVNVTNYSSYRPPYQGSDEEVALRCANEFENAILHEGPKTVAAMVAEPISAAFGVQVPPPIYWKRLREIADKYSVVLIADEVITGFGRTGTMFCLERWGVKPDMTVVAKALTSGYLPLGGVIINREIGDAFIGDDSKSFHHIITFGGHPSACAAAMANLDLMEKEGMLANTVAMEPIFRAGLTELMERHKVVGDVRGIGLIWALELVKDRETKAPFPPEANLLEKLNRILYKNGLLHFRVGNIIPLSPPLNITKSEAEFIFERLDVALTELEAELGVV